MLRETLMDARTKRIASTIFIAYVVASYPVFLSSFLVTPFGPPEPPWELPTRFEYVLLFISSPIWAPLVMYYSTALTVFVGFSIKSDGLIPLSVFLVVFTCVATALILWDWKEWANDIPDNSA